MARYEMGQDGVLVANMEWTCGDRDGDGWNGMEGMVVVELLVVALGVEVHVGVRGAEEGEGGYERAVCMRVTG